MIQVQYTDFMSVGEHTPACVLTVLLVLTQYVLPTNTTDDEKSHLLKKQQQWHSETHV